MTENLTNAIRVHLQTKYGLRDAKAHLAAAEIVEIMAHAPVELADVCACVECLARRAG